MKQSTFNKYSFLFLFSLFAHSTIIGAIIHVPLDSATIQAAINGASDGDTVLIAPGTYKGLGNKNLRTWGKKITVASQAGATQTIIDCENSGNGFTIRDHETNATVISGFTVTNSENGIYLDKSSPIIEDCVLENNRAGIYAFSSSNPIIQRCIVRNNTNRGGIFLNQAATVIDCTIVGNYNYSLYEGGA